MNIVAERLIESWLASQTERRYQPAFIQLLNSEGWTVLHNTRHSPIEFGKDVIARNPSGSLYCFQLKGDTKGRLTKMAAQGHLPQLIELLETPVPAIYRKTDGERHISVFVTNGEVDEEARSLFESAAERVKKRTCPSRKFELWPGGQLLSMFRNVAGRVWPTSPEGVREILNVMASNGNETPIPETLSRVFSTAVEKPSAKASSQSKSADLDALLLLAEIIKSPWYATENHYALYLVSVMVSVYGFHFADSARRLAAVTRYAHICLEHCSECAGRPARNGWWKSNAAKG